ncbi:GAF domain-containing protein [Winogradskya consettensis]|nr:GAF domain-containing protein [Actinoplanes consettensis]
MDFLSPPGEIGEVASLVMQLRAEGGTAALCGHCHHDIPSLSGVGLTVLASGGRRFVLGTSGLLIDQVEDLQIRLDQGPCLQALTVRAPVLVEDLADTQARRSWPQFAPEALRGGVAAVFAFPVLTGTLPVAILDLCRATAGPLPRYAYERAVTYAAAAAVLLVDDLPDKAHDGDGAAVSIPAARTQEATGRVMGQAATDATDALHRLRAHAFDRHLPLGTVVNDVLDGTLRFEPQPDS